MSDYCADNCSQAVRDTDKMLPKECITKKDLRTTALPWTPTVSCNRVPLQKREREFDDFLKDKMVEAKSDFRDLLRECKVITHKWVWEIRAVLLQSIFAVVLQHPTVLWLIVVCFEVARTNVRWPVRVLRRCCLATVAKRAPLCRVA